MRKVTSYYKVDLATISSQRKKIKELQKAGLYPNKFDFPLLLQFELTRRCNVFCKHCYNNSGADNIEPDAMTPTKWKEFAKYVVSKGGIFECVISGGEPLLLGDDLFGIMDILHNDGTNFLLITNGYLLSHDKIEKLKKYRYKWIQISIDGCNAKYHDDFRQRDGCWERAVNGALMVSGAGLPLTIAHCVSPQNLKDIDEMCDLAYALGAGNIILGCISLSGRTFDNNYLLLNEEEKEFLIDRIEYNSKKYRGKMQITRSMEEPLQYERQKELPCGGLIIRPNGDIRLDCMTPFVFGNVLKDDFSTVWKEKCTHCWNNEMIKEYYSNDCSTVKNYVDKDIYI